MNRNQTTLLIFLLVVVGLAGLMIYNKRNDYSGAGNPAIGKKLLGEFPLNDVARLTIKGGGTNELNLVKKDGLWRVRERNDYPANYSQISEFLLKLRDLKITQSEKVGASQLPRFGLVPGEGTNSAMVVDFKDQNDKTIQSLLLGKKHMRKSNRPSPFGDDMEGGGWPDGRYVKAGPGADSVVLISDALANIEPKADQWLNKDFFKVEKVRSVNVAFPAATNSWKLSRETETGEWKLAEAKPGEQLDTSKASSVSNPLSSPTFNDVDTSSKPEQLGLDKPTVVTLDTFDNFTYVLKVGQKTNDNYPLAFTVAAQLQKERTPGKDEKPEDKDKLDKEFKEKQKKLEEKLAQEKNYEKWTYLVSSWSLEPLLKERTQLLVEKKEEPKKDEKSAAATGAATNAPPAADSSAAK
ncbi:MAG TPA: DUF4340 domain-containing protein [Verrucomicrobiae bacterium]